MGNKRKRPGAPTQRPRPISPVKDPRHPVISLYYPEVVTLRQYLLRCLPVSSKSRRRRIVSLASQDVAGLAHLLDSTLVGVRQASSPTLNSARVQDYLAFSQSQSRSILVSTDTGPACPQSEVVDFVVWRIFHRNVAEKPQHLLAHGFQRSGPGANALQTDIPGLSVQFPNQNVQTLKQAPWTDVLGLLGENGEEIMMQLLFDCGVFTCVDDRKGIFYQLSGMPLSNLEPVAGSRPGEAVSTGKDPVHGIPQNPSTEKRHQKHEARQARGLNSITLLRRRILYARLTDKSNRKSQSGLGSAHVLNRCTSLDSAEQSAHIMKYIFPRQFGLQNIFTCDNIEYSKNYMDREDEISQLEARKQTQKPQPKSAPTLNEDRDSPKLPKRLRGPAGELVQRLRNRHARCSYGELLKHYCPSDVIGPGRLSPASQTQSTSAADDPIFSTGEKLVTQAKMNQPHQDNEGYPAASQEPTTGDHQMIQKPKTRMMDYATPVSSVSAFCRAVIQKLIPPTFYGVGAEGLANRRIALKHIDHFIKMRRFESLSLHELCKGMKITSIPWLEPPRLHDTKHRIALSDFQKRMEIFHEFVYYIFDSILIPLIRTNFYVTESQTHRNRLFYFRQDVWQQLTEQPFADLKASMFEELPIDRAKAVVAQSSLGFGALRLLPKATGLRPILNLRKRCLKPTAWGGKRAYYAPSINSSITPIYNMLTYERQRAPSKMGSSLHSMGDMYHRLWNFKRQLAQRQSGQGKGAQSRIPPLFFVKLDIQACFDTIPQKKLVHLIETLVSERSYHITRHVEIRPSDLPTSKWKTSRKYAGRAAPAMQPQSLPELITSGVQGRSENAVFVDTVNQKAHGAEDLLDLLDEHVRNNLVRMGNKYFRQRNGIPQGSVLSSLLCNFFYAEFEREVLGFLRREDTLLLRLVDDFLLITPDAGLAMRFAQVMIPGQPSHNVSVNAAKSLVNFTAAVNGIHIPRLEGSSLFPYCGCLIDTHTLEIHRDHDRMLEPGDSAAATISNTLTVEATRLPGHVFRRKVLSAYRLQMHPMYLDDIHNSRTVVLVNLYTSLVASAMKTYSHMKSLRGRAHPSPPVIIRTIHDLILQTARMIQARSAATNSSSSSVSFSCFVARRHIQCLTAAAFRFVMVRKQTRYATVLRWLDQLAKQARPSSDAEALRMAQVVRKGNAVFDDWRF